MYISIITLSVADVDRAIAFYTDKLGWETTMDVPMGEDRWVTIAPPEGMTAFTLSKEPEEERGMSGVILEVDDVYKTYERLTKLGIEFPQPPRTEPWGGWAMFADSEGNVHGLHSPVPS